MLNGRQRPHNLFRHHLFFVPLVHKNRFTKNQVQPRQGQRDQVMVPAVHGIAQVGKTAHRNDRRFRLTRQERGSSFGRKCGAVWAVVEQWVKAKRRVTPPRINTPRLIGVQGNPGLV